MSDTQDSSFEKTISTSSTNSGGATSTVDYIGSTISGRYQVQTLVGRGGMGALYAAQHVDIGRKVAIKVLHPEFRVSEDIFARFKQEATLAATLQHANICSVYDFGKLDDGTPYLIMDLLQGLTLADMITREGRIEPRRAVRIFAQICDALTHAHKKGVAHRDLKPSNIMIENEDGIELAKIVDFGIAKSLEKDAPHLTATHEAIGSPYYMSPEQCQAGPIDHRTDIYSLGCLMYETLTGRTPFKASNALQMMFAHVHNDPEALNSVAPAAEIPGELELVVLKAMAKNPDDRFQTADDLKQAAFTAVGAKTLDCLVDAAKYREYFGDTMSKAGGALSKSGAASSKGGGSSKNGGEISNSPEAQTGGQAPSSKKPLIFAAAAIALMGIVGAIAFANQESIALMLDGRKPGYIYNGDDAPVHWSLPNVSDPQVHAVYVSQAHDTPRSHDNDTSIMGHVTVHVTQRHPNVILVLNSNAQIEWKIVREPGTKVQKVLVTSSYGKSEVKGVPVGDVERIKSVSLSLSEGENLMENSYFVEFFNEVEKACGKKIAGMTYASQVKAVEI